MRPRPSPPKPAPPPSVKAAAKAIARLLAEQDADAQYAKKEAARGA